MTDAAVVQPDKLDIARVLEGTFKALSRNIVTFGVLALLLAGLPAAIIGAIQVSLLRGAGGAISTDMFLNPGYWTNAGLGGLAGLILNAILQGALIQATVEDLNGGRPTVGAALATGLRNFLPLIGVTILFALAVGFGTVLLIVPGIMIACAWCVAVPSLVADRTGVFGAFSRAADLTRGNRWRIFALGIVIGIIMIVVDAVFNAVVGVSAFATDPLQTLDRLLSPVFLVASVIRSTVTSVIGAALVAVLYVELRRLKEGAAPGWLADIFS